MSDETPKPENKELRADRCAGEVPAMSHPVPADTSLAEFLDQEYLPRHLGAATEATARDYHRSVRHFDRFLNHPPGLADLTDANLLRFAKWRLDQHLSPATVRGDFVRLVALWKWAAHHHFVTEYPDVRCPCKAPKRAPTAWTPQQFSRLLTATNTMRRSICGMATSKWWHAFCLVARDTGFRKNALLNLAWSDLDWETSTILARAEFSKTGQDMQVGLSPDSITALHGIQKPERRLIFPYDKRPDTSFYCQWNRVLKTAGLPSGRRDKTHKLRRTCASWIAGMGGLEAARRQMGHSTSAMTREFYVDESFLPDSNYANQFPRPSSLESASGNGNGNENRNGNGNGHAVAVVVGAAIEAAFKPVATERSKEHQAPTQSLVVGRKIGPRKQRIKRQPIVGEQVFTTGQVAKICSMAPRTVMRCFDSGRLKGYRIPGSQDRRIPREYLIRFLKENGMPLGDLEDKAMVGARAFDYYAQQPKERQKRKSADSVPESLPEQKTDSRDAAGEAVGVSGKSIDLEAFKPVIDSKPPQPPQSVPQGEDELDIALDPGNAPAATSIAQETSHKARPSVVALDIPIPKARLGNMLLCRLAGGEVKVSGFMGPLQWPATGPGNHLAPAVTDDLARALQTERPKRLAELLGVSLGAVVRWARQVGNRDLVVATR